MIPGILRDLVLSLLLVVAPIAAYVAIDREVEERRATAVHDALAVQVGERLDRERIRAASALDRFCRNDLALDAWLAARRGGNASIAEGALRRNVDVLAEAIGFFDAVLILDATRDRMKGRVVAGAGERVTPSRAATLRAGPIATPGSYAGALLERVTRGSRDPFAIETEGAEEPGLAWVARCTAEREGVAVVVAGLTELDRPAFAARFVLPDETLLLLERARRHVDPTLPSPTHRRVIAEVEDERGRAVATIAIARERGDALARHRRALAAALGAGVMLAVLVALFSGVRRRRGLLALEQAAERIGQGDLDSTLGERLSGELRPTATAFGRMTEELQKAQARLRRAERIAAWRDIARALAHELKNPLSPIQVSIESLRKAHAKRLPELDEIFEESTRAILEEVERMKRTLDEFTRFARVPPPRPEPLDLREIVEHVVRLHEHGDVAIRVEGAEAPAVVRADREQITQVLVNLVKNAIEAVSATRGDAGHVVVAIRPGETKTVLEVRDDGPGVPIGKRASIFEPYVTGKPGGTGLGLAITHRIVAEHGGTIDVGTAPEGGASFEITLENAGPVPQAESSLSAEALPLVKRETPDGS